MFKTVNNGKLPTRATKYSACVDLYANEDVVIGAGETKMIGLGVKIDLSQLADRLRQVINTKRRMKKGNSKATSESLESIKQSNVNRFKKYHYLQLAPRSSLRAKGLISGIGIIDLDYKDEIKLIVHNPTKPYTIKEDFATRTYVKNTDCFTIKKGDRIAQITLLEHKSYLFRIDSEEDRNGGFGSTGNE